MIFFSFRSLPTCWCRLSTHDDTALRSSASLCHMLCWSAHGARMKLRYVSQLPRSHHDRPRSCSRDGCSRETGNSELEYFAPPRCNLIMNWLGLLMSPSFAWTNEWLITRFHTFFFNSFVTFLVSENVIYGHGSVPSKIPLNSTQNALYIYSYFGHCSREKTGIAIFKVVFGSCNAEQSFTNRSSRLNFALSMQFVYFGVRSMHAVIQAMNKLRRMRGLDGKKLRRGNVQRQVQMLFSHFFNSGRMLGFSFFFNRRI